MREPVYYEYNLTYNKVYIAYGTIYKVNEYVHLENEKKGKTEKYEHKYGNGIEIENFENYNFGIDLAIDYPILFGSAYDRGEGEKRDYEFVKGFPMAYFPKSNGQGTITVDKKDLKGLELTNIYNRDQVENKDFKLVIDLIETDIKYDENYGFKSRDEKYLLVYNTHREELIILYKNREEDETIIDLYRSRKAKEEYTIKGYKKILIKDFKNKDYGIKIPYNSTTLYGSLVKSVHTVVEGDSLWKIAEKELNSGQRWRELLHYNCEPVTSKDPKLLKIGEKIIIPKD